MDYWFNDAYEFPHIVVLAPANEEDLLGFSKVAILKPEIALWLDENIGYDMYLHDGGVLSFSTKEDALAFILRWR